MSYAAHRYRKAAETALAPRDAEAAAFTLVNRLLSEPKDRLARLRGLAKNQELWSFLLRDLGSSGNALPPVLKADLTRIGIWAMRESIAAMGDDRPLDELVEMNAQIIAGLRSADTGPGEAQAAA